MSGIVGIFASIGEHIPFTKSEKRGRADSEGSVCSFHYRGTVLLLIAFSILVTTTEWIAGIHNHLKEIIERNTKIFNIPIKVSKM